MLGDKSLSAELDVDMSGNVDLREWLDYIRGQHEKRSKAGDTWLQQFILAFKSDPVPWDQLETSRLFKQAEDVYLDIAAKAEVDGVFQGISKDVLSAGYMSTNLIRRADNRVP